MHIQLYSKHWLLFKVLFMTVWVKNWFHTPWSEVCQIMLFSFTWLVFSPPYKAPASTPPEFCSAILLFHLLFLLPCLDMFKHNVTQKHVLTMRIVCIIHVWLQIFYSWQQSYDDKLFNSSNHLLFLNSNFEINGSVCKIYRPQYGNAGT